MANMVGRKLHSWNFRKNFHWLPNILSIVIKIWHKDCGPLGNIDFFFGGGAVAIKSDCKKLLEILKGCEPTSSSRPELW